MCEVECDAPGTRILVVHSDERLAFEKAEREKAMAKVARQLEALARRVAQGRQGGEIHVVQVEPSASSPARASTSSSAKG